MSLLPEISQASAEINKLVAQANIHQTIAPVDPAAFTDPADTMLLASRDPVIREVSVGMTGEAYSDYSVSGTPPLSLPNSLGKPLKAWSVDVLPHQEGTGDPSPDNVRPIHGTDKLTIYMQETLADGYIRLEYAESNSTQQYVETDVVPFAGMGFSCTYYTNNIVGTSDYGCIFGARLGSNIDDFQLTTYSDNPQARLGLFRWGTGNQYSAGIISQVKQTTTLINDVLTLPDGSTTAVTSPSSFTTNSLMLHALNNGLIGAVQFGRCRIYDFIVYYGDVVYRHYVPCKRTSDNTVGYYETETQTFLVPRGGNLIAGNPVSSSSVINLPQTVYNGAVGNGNGESRWASKTIGDFQWTYFAPSSSYPYGFFYCNISEKAYGSLNIMCSEYKAREDFNVDKTCFGNRTNNVVYIIDSDYSDVNDFVQARDGVQLVYELSTPAQFPLTTSPIPTPTGSATTWATAEDGIVDGMEVTYVGKA